MILFYFKIKYHSKISKTLKNESPIFAERKESRFERFWNNKIYFDQDDLLIFTIIFSCPLDYKAMNLLAIKLLLITQLSKKKHDFYQFPPS